MADDDNIDGRVAQRLPALRRRTTPQAYAGPNVVVLRPLAPQPNAPRVLTRHDLVRLVTLAVILGAILGARGAIDLAGRWRFSVNLTDSLPNWAFIVDRANRRPQIGELIAFTPPPTRWYGRGAVFTKRVAGGPGDVVTRQGRAFYVSGRFVGRAKERARDGTPADLGPTGTIPPGRYFVVTDHIDSLDSRYAPIGWISASSILGVARPVL